MADIGRPTLYNDELADGQFDPNDDDNWPPIPWHEAFKEEAPEEDGSNT